MDERTGSIYPVIERIKSVPKVQNWEDYLDDKFEGSTFEKLKKAPKKKIKGQTAKDIMRQKQEEQEIFFDN